MTQTLTENSIKRLIVQAVGLIGFIPAFVIDARENEGPMANTQRCLCMIENGQWRQTPIPHPQPR